MDQKIEAALEDMRSGGMVILVDDEDRENEGDLVVAAEFATPEIINFTLNFLDLGFLTATHSMIPVLCGQKLCERINGSLDRSDFRDSVKEHIWGCPSRQSRILVREGWDKDCVFNHDLKQAATYNGGIVVIESCEKRLQLGCEVPDFEIDTYEPSIKNFGKLSLEEQKTAGKWTILFFYPADFTFV